MNIDNKGNEFRREMVVDVDLFILTKGENNNVFLFLE